MFVKMVIIFLMVPVIQFFISANNVREVVHHTVKFSHRIFIYMDIREDFPVKVSPWTVGCVENHTAVLKR